MKIKIWVLSSVGAAAMLCAAPNAHAIDNNYKAALSTLCDALLSTQITDKSNADYGALTCPSTNPDNRPVHSRCAEAVYPFAVLYKLDTTKTKYRDAAIVLGDWLCTIQESSGANSGSWDESWPLTTGWHGTTADQLISLAGAYPILKPYLSSSESATWIGAITRAADWSVGFFPQGNINYNAVSAAALVVASNAVPSPKAVWLTKADVLMNRNTLDSINSENLLTGEGKGVDQGYDMAQSIGYVALYAILKNSAAIKQRAVDMLHAHYRFVYPNGSVDNSWGTRSFKWGYESGTKTAPGVYFSFALLADADPTFNAAGLACLDFLRTKCINSSGWIVYGPHALKHTTSTPPCNYQTFARAQSIALSIEYGPNVTSTAPFPGQVVNWYTYYSTIKVAVVRTQKIMATVSSYGQIGTYSRSTVPKGGSVCNLWYEGFGDNGFLQSSSATDYTRTEAMHMPIESVTPVTLTPRVESTMGGTYYTNLYETGASMNVVKNADNVSVTSSGKLVSQAGGSSAAGFSIVNRFYATSVKKEITVSGAASSYKIIEPFIRDPGTVFARTSASTVTVTPASGAVWTVRVDSASTVPYALTIGTDSARYWCPFPGIEGYPVIISFTTASTAAQTISLSIDGPPTTSVAPDSPARSAAAGALSVRHSSGEAALTFVAGKNGLASVRVYSVAGRLVASPFDGIAGAGEHAVSWNPGKSLPHGIYLCALTCNGREVASMLWENR
jgi:hypothetical protein